MITAEEMLEKASMLAKSNYKRNKKRRLPEGLINGQKECTVAKYNFGIRHMSTNGCGPIAIYNALYHARLAPDFNAIALGLETYSLRAFGIFGVNPEKLDRFFSECRIAAIRAKDYADFVGVMGAVKVGILCYWVADPKISLLHFVTIIRNDDGTYSVCNRYSNRKTPSQIPSIEKLCTEERYVAGYFIS